MPLVVWHAHFMLMDVQTVNNKQKDDNDYNNNNSNNNNGDIQGNYSVYKSPPPILFRTRLTKSKA
jgi:hypothetical protein